MNKKEYIDSLKKHLKDESYETVCQVIEYYEEIIDDMCEDGMSEKEAIIQLTDVDEVVRAIKDVPTYEIKPMKTSLKAIWLIVLIVTFPLWGCLFAAFLLLVLSVYIVVWCLPIVTGAIAFAGIVCFIVGIFGAFPLWMSSLALGLTQLGVSAIFGGVGMLAIVLTILAYQKIVEVSKQITNGTKIIIFSLLRKVGVLC